METAMNYLPFDFFNDFSNSSIPLRTNILPKKTFRIESTLKLKAIQS